MKTAATAAAAPHTVQSRAEHTHTPNRCEKESPKSVFRAAAVGNETRNVLSAVVGNATATSLSDNLRAFRRKKNSHTIYARKWLLWQRPATRLTIFFRLSLEIYIFFFRFFFSFFIGAHLESLVHACRCRRMRFILIAQLTVSRTPLGISTDRPNHARTAHFDPNAPTFNIDHLRRARSRPSLAVFRTRYRKKLR